jgi:hypothetical protein
MLQGIELQNILYTAQWDLKPVLFGIEDEEYNNWQENILVIMMQYRCCEAAVLYQVRSSGVIQWYYWK